MAIIIVATLFTQREREMVCSVVSNSQNAFVEGRQILEVVLLENKVIDSRLNSSIGRVVYKLDIKKAYNNINWDFLLAVSENEIQPKVGGYIKWCISTARF